MPEPFSIVDAFHSALRDDEDLPQPIAAIFALSEMIASSNAATTSELMESIKTASEELKQSLSNPIPASAGLELFMRFVTTKNWAGGVRISTYAGLSSTQTQSHYDRARVCTQYGAELPRAHHDAPSPVHQGRYGRFLR